MLNFTSTEKKIPIVFFIWFLVLCVVSNSYFEALNLVHEESQVLESAPESVDGLISQGSLVINQNTRIVADNSTGSFKLYYVVSVSTFNIMTLMILLAPWALMIYASVVHRGKIKDLKS